MPSALSLFDNTRNQNTAETTTRGQSLIIGRWRNKTDLQNSKHSVTWQDTHAYHVPYNERAGVAVHTFVAVYLPLPCTVSRDTWGLSTSIRGWSVTHTRVRCTKSRTWSILTILRCFCENRSFGNVVYSKIMHGKRLSTSRGKLLYLT